MDTTPSTPAFAEPTGDDGQPVGKHARTLARRVTVGTLLFAAVLVLWLVRWGDPANGLHREALSNTFLLGGTVIVSTLGHAALAAWQTIRSGKS